MPSQPGLAPVQSLSPVGLRNAPEAHCAPVQEVTSDAITTYSRPLLRQTPLLRQISA